MNNNYSGTIREHFSLRNFNAKEMDLFFSISSKLLKEPDLLKVRFSFSELRELSNYKMTAIKQFIKSLEGVFSKMLQLTYREETEETITYLALLEDCKIDKENQIVELTLHPEFPYVLDKLNKEFTQEELQEFTELKSSYSKMLYRILNQHKDIGFYSIKIDEFRHVFDIPANYRMSDIDKKVLKPIKRELPNYFASFNVNKVKGIKGNVIDHLEFSFKVK